MFKKLTVMSMFLSAPTLAGFNISDARTAELTQKECMALNIYHESRSESIDGQLAVAYVTLNRVYSKNYPFTICEVVFQNKQFSWTQDGLSDKVNDKVSWQKALDIAQYSLDSYVEYQAINDGALFYHTTAIKPFWSLTMKPLKVIDNHIYY